MKTTHGHGKDEGKRNEARPRPPKTSTGGEVGLGGLFRGLGSLVESLSELAERGGQVIERHGEVGGDKGTRVVYGVTMRVGGEGKPQVESFGNVRKGRGGAAEVVATREPIVDVFEEDDGIRVLAEMPGVEEKDVSYELPGGDQLVIRATRGDRRYEKDVELPTAVIAEGAVQSFRNGIFELALKRAE